MYEAIAGKQKCRKAPLVVDWAVVLSAQLKMVTEDYRGP